MGVTFRLDVGLETEVLDDFLQGLNSPVVVAASRWVLAAA